MPCLLAMILATYSDYSAPLTGTQSLLIVLTERWTGEGSSDLDFCPVSVVLVEEQRLVPPPMMLMRTGVV